MIEIHREATILGLKYLQAGANKAALDALVEAQDTEYGKAKQDYNEGTTFSRKFLIFLVDGSC